MSEQPVSEEDADASDEKGNPVPPPPPPPGFGFPPPPNEDSPPPMTSDMPIQEGKSDHSDVEIDNVIDAESAMATLRGLSFGENAVSEENTSCALFVSSICQCSMGLYSLNSVFNFLEMIELPIVITNSGKNSGLP